MLQVTDELHDDHVGLSSGHSVSQCLSAQTSRNMPTCHDGVASTSGPDHTSDQGAFHFL